jgi:predicted nucleic acid-binding Zn ribbon protein
VSFRRVGSDLQGLLSEWLENPESRRLVLQRTWERAVGEAVSRRCRALQFDDGVLTVEVTDSSWAPQLKTMSGELITKVNIALGKPWVRRIDWVHGDGPPDTSGAQPRSG